MLWAHPEAPGSSIQLEFFESLFILLDQAYEAGRTPDFLQLCLSQHEVATAGVMFPTAWVAWCFKVVSSVGRAGRSGAGCEVVWI